MSDSPVAPSLEHDACRHRYDTAFAVGVVINLVFVAIEFGFGVAAHSVALIADASHNLSDVLTLVVAWGAHLLARREPSKYFTYGLRSSTIVAALINAVLLLAVTGGIAWETLERLRRPTDVEAETMIWVAVAGVVVNTVTALLFMSGSSRDLNIRGAFLHMLGDAAVSVGVVLAGLGIYFKGWLWLDATISMVIVLVILIGTVDFLWQSLLLSLHAVPPGIDVQTVQAYLDSLPGVTTANHLHVWGMSTTETALTVHLLMPAGHPGDEFLAQACRDLHDRFNIQHATIQVDLNDTDRHCRPTSTSSHAGHSH